MSTKFVQAKATTLAVGISAADVSILLKRMVDAYGNQLTMTNFGTIGYFTKDPGGSGEEIGSFTGATVNSDSTVLLTGVTRGLAAVYPYGAGGTASDSAAGVTVVFSDNPQLLASMINNWDAETIAGVKTFTDSPIVPTPTTPTQAANKAYADGLTYVGAPDASTTTKGIVQEASQAQIDARTATGSTSAKLFGPLDKQRSTQLSDYVASDTGAADAYAIAPTPPITAYAAGQRFTFKVAHTNTTASTLAVSGLASPKAIKKLDGVTALVAGDLVAGQIVEVEYDGTNFQLLTPANKIPSTSLNVGTGANQLVQLDGSSKLPAVDGSNLTNISLLTKIGSSSRSGTASSGTVTIAHGLGRIPKVARFYGQVTSGPAGTGLSIGVYDGISNHCNYSLGNNGGGTNTGIASAVMYFGDVGSNPHDRTQMAVCAVDATNITLTWTKVNEGASVDLNFIWEVQG